MASSSVISIDTMSASSSSGTHSVSPSTMTGNRAQTQTVSNGHESSSYQSWHYSSSSLSPAADDVQPSNRRVKQSELTTPSSPDCRTTRPPTVPPPTIPNFDTPPDVAISVPNNNNYYNIRQDVLPVVNTSAPFNYPSTAHRNVYPSTPLESPLSSFSTFPNDDSINQPNTRPRTSTQVFSTPQDLAAHYGIPTILPPAPRTTPRRTQHSPQQGYTPPTDFAALSSNYLNMLSQKPEVNMAADNTPAVTTVAPADLTSPAQASDQELQTLIDVLLASPAYRSPEIPSSEFASPEFTSPNEFLTSPYSPFDDSPFEDFLSTPVIPDSNDMDMDMLTSPLIGGDLSLFPDMPLFETAAPKQPVEAPAPRFEQIDNMYTISPATPSLDPSYLYPSPRQPSVKPLPSSTRRKSSATGTRKNITPESLVPLDAPTQPRKYVTPSATSRKELPAVFAKKRARSQAFGDEEDELAEEPLGPNATEKEQIEWKRRQNTLAARKSRKRKLQHQQQLEDQVDQLTMEKEVWKTRALTLQNMLQSHGIPCNQFDD